MDCRDKCNCFQKEILVLIEVLLNLIISHRKVNSHRWGVKSNNQSPTAYFVGADIALVCDFGLQKQKPISLLEFCSASTLSSIFESYGLCLGFRLTSLMPIGSSLLPALGNSLTPGIQGLSQLNTFAHAAFFLGASIILTLIPTCPNPTHSQDPVRMPPGLQARREISSVYTLLALLKCLLCVAGTSFDHALWSCAILNSSNSHPTPL